MAVYKKVPGHETVNISTLEFDETPTPGSLNPVTSGGVAEAQGATDNKLEELAELFFLNTKNIEVPSKKAMVGYALYADSNGNKHFICDKSLDAASIPAGWEFVGPMALREGDKAKILYKAVYSTSFINFWLFKLSGLKLDGTDELTMRQASNSDDSTIEVGTFTASAEATDLDTFISELDEWLRDNPTVEGAVPNYNWHAEKIKDAEGTDCCFIVVDNIVVKTRVSPLKSSSSGATCTAYSFEFSGIDTSETLPVRKDGRKTMYCLWNVDYFKYVNTSIGSPSDTLQANGVYNEAGFNATTILKAHYGTYDAYLEDMMVDVNATDGIMPVYKGTGKSVTTKLDAVVVNKLDGTQINLFKSAHYATTLKAHSSATVAGLDLGDWYIAAIDEKSEILGQMLYNGSDVINTTLVKAGQNKFDLSAVVWAPAKYSATEGVVFANQSRFNSNYLGNQYYRDIYVAEIDL